MCAYLIFVISFTQARFSYSKFYTQKYPKIPNKYPKNSKICSFSRSIWKILHLTELFYTGIAHGARDKYQVCLCDHTFGARLDLTCPSFRGFNSDKVRSAPAAPAALHHIEGIFSNVANFFQSLNGDSWGSRSPIIEVKKGKSSEFNPRNDGQVKFSPVPKVWSHEGFHLYLKTVKIS